MGVFGLGFAAVDRGIRLRRGAVMDEVRVERLGEKVVALLEMFVKAFGDFAEWLRRRAVRTWVLCKQTRKVGVGTALQEAYRRREPDFQRYGGAVVLVAFSLALRLFLSPLLVGNSPYLTTYLAVAIAAVWFGTGPAVMVTAATGLLATLMFVPSGAWLRDPAAVARLVVMLLSCVAIAAIGGAARRAKHGLAREAKLARRAEEAVRKAMEEAAQANAAKDHFLAVLSHELRTPLTPVLATSQMLEVDRTLSEDQRDQVKMIRRNVELEARLIDDLLDLTRVSRGKLELHTGPVDVHEKINEVLRICETEIGAKQIRVTTSLGALAHDVEADGARLQQVLWNLIRNAVKFTPARGGIAVWTSNTEEGGIAVQVRDTGVGIEPERLKSVFQAFEQGGREVTKKFGGLGLGLAISKALVELHKGKIEATSEGRGKGATFTVTLPKAMAGHVVKGSGDTVMGRVGLSVLLVEDHTDTRAVMARLLKGLGCRVTTAGSVAEAMLALSRGKFDLVISDIGLPDGSGVDLMKAARGQYSVKGIALSGYGMDEDVARSEEAGFAAHLTKPVNVMALEEVIRRVVA